MKATQTFFQGFTITIKENNGLHRATAISKQAVIEAVYGLSSNEAILRMKLQILKNLASRMNKPCLVVQDNYVLYMNLATQSSLETTQTAGLSVEKVFAELLNIKPCVQIVGLLEASPMRLIAFK